MPKEGDWKNSDDKNLLFSKDKMFIQQRLHPLRLGGSVQSFITIVTWISKAMSAAHIGYRSEQHKKAGLDL